MTKIILLDIDGVLVHAGGYRAALRATVNHFAGNSIDINETILSDLERRGISSEWDMVPLLLASYWNLILSQQPMHDLPDDISAAAQEIQRRVHLNGSRSFSIPEFDLIDGQYPAESAFRAGCFSSVPYELQKNLLTETRNVHASHTMRIFQNYSLGTENFRSTYQIPAELNTDSFLLAYDRSNIDENVRAKLRQPNIFPVAFTARPSAPPRGSGEPSLGYAPEAELGLALTELENIPIMAFGKLEYIARRRGLDPVKLVKPSPVHALAGVIAAFTGDEWLAIQSAADWYQTGRLNDSFMTIPEAFDLIVIEDTLGGIRSTQAAGEILKQAGFQVNVHLFGLTSGNPKKAAAFKDAGVPHFENWESLLKQLPLNNTQPKEKKETESFSVDSADSSALPL